MKKPVLSMMLASAIALAVPACTQAQELEYFPEGLEWGMSKEEIDNSEFLTDHPDNVYYADSNVYIVSDVVVAGRPFTVCLGFSDNQLQRIVYYLEEHNYDSSKDYAAFLSLEADLTLKYGEPKESSDDWEDETYKGNTYDYGLAVAEGDVEFHREWDLDDQILFLDCEGFDNEVSTSISYNSVFSQVKEATQDLNSEMSQLDSYAQSIKDATVGYEEASAEFTNKMKEYLSSEMELSLDDETHLTNLCQNMYSYTWEALKYYKDRTLFYWVTVLFDGEENDTCKEIEDTYTKSFDQNVSKADENKQLLAQSLKTVLADHKITSGELEKCIKYVTVYDQIISEVEITNVN